MKVYFEGNYDRARMLAGLGRTFAGGKLQYKAWPVNGLAHTYIHATLTLIRKHKLTAADIQGDPTTTWATSSSTCAIGSKPAAFRGPPWTRGSACRLRWAGRGARRILHPAVHEQGLSNPAVLAAAEKGCARE